MSEKLIVKRKPPPRCVDKDKCVQFLSEGLGIPLCIDRRGIDCPTLTEPTTDQYLARIFARCLEESPLLFDSRGDETPLE